MAEGPWNKYTRSQDDGPWKNYKTPPSVDSQEEQPAAQPKATTSDNGSIEPITLGRRIQQDIESLAPNLLSTEEVPLTGKPRGFFPALIKGLSESPLHIPRVATVPEDSTFKKVGAGVADVASGAAEFITSPLGAATMATGGLSKVAGKALAIGYGGVMSYEGGKGVIKGIEDKDAREITSGALTAGLGGLGVKHGVIDATIEKAAPILPQAAAAAAQAVHGGAQAELPPDLQAKSKANKGVLPTGAPDAVTQRPPVSPAVPAPEAVPPSPTSVKPAATPARAVETQTSLALEPAHQELLDTAAKEGKHDVEFVTRPLEDNEPFARQIATPDRKTGKILINPSELSKWLDSVPEANRKAAMRSLLGEEAIHLATADKDALSYHDAATGLERAAAQRIYGGKGGTSLSPLMLGHEMLRQRMQQLARMGVREAVEASGREKWTVKGLLLLNEVVGKARETLGTKASKEQRGILDRVQGNLDAAIAAKSGETPGATRKGQDERTPEFFLPPMAGSVDRPAASDLGALPEQKIPPEQALKSDTVLWNKPNAWRRITTELLHKPASLGKMLTEGSRGSETDPVSATRRLVAMEKNGKVDVVSIYPDAEDGARAVDPAYAGKTARPNVPLKALLDEGYKPIVSMLRTDAVQNFHRHFDSVQQFEDTVGKPGDQQWANVRGYEAQTVATQASSFGKGTDMTDSEAAALHDHFIEHDTVDKAVDAIAASPNVHQMRSALGKAINQIMGKDKSLTREEAAGKAVEQLYEKSKSAEHRQDFIKSALGEFGQESPESSGHQPGETVNDLGRESAPTEDESTPAATRKFASDQIKATEDDIRAVVSRGKIYDTLARTIDAAGNIPNLVAEREGNNIRLASVEKPKGIRAKLSQFTRGNKDVLAAANAVVQAGFDRTKLPGFRNLVEQGIEKATEMSKSKDWRARSMGQKWLRSQNELMKELDYAQEHWDDKDLKNTAHRMADGLHQQWNREIDAGIDVRKDENYDPQRYDAAVWNEKSILFSAIEGSEKVLGTRYSQPRKFETYYHAGADGPYIPVTRDGASLVSHRVRQGMSKIERNAWVDGLKAVTMPDGKPLAMEAKYVPTTSGVTTAPGGLAAAVPTDYTLAQPESRDYSTMLVNGKAIYVHDAAKGMIRNLTDPSAFEHWPVAKAALRLTQQLKHGLLLGDFFHLGRMGYYAASIMGKDAGFTGGWSALDIKPENINEAVRKGVISQADADWAREKINFGDQKIERRQLVEKFVRAGANLGKIQDALYKDLITDLTPAASPTRRAVSRLVDPSVGRYNRFLFDKLTRGLMTESNVREFERQSKANPNADPDALVRDISRDVNNYFGNIGKQGWMKSATQKDLARMFLLAPDWLEGLIKKEATFYGRASGASKLAGRREGVTNLGTTGRGIGRGLVFLLGMTQAINLITRKQPTWQNDEKGHQFDAWIPSVGKDGEGFWFSPLSVFNEITHDVWRYAQGDKTVLGAIDQVAGNKESPLAHAAIIALTGTGALGGKSTTSMGQLGQAAKQLAPVPLTFGRLGQAAGHAVAPSIVPPTPPGALQRQLTASAGLKMEPKLSGVQELSAKARNFANENGFEKESGWKQVETDEPSYSKLRSALRNGDDAEAKRQYEALRKSRTDKTIFHYMKLAKNRPFTGSKKAESAFIRTLDDKGLADYLKAVQQRDGEYQKWIDFALKQ